MTDKFNVLLKNNILNGIILKNEII